MTRLTAVVIAAATSFVFAGRAAEAQTSRRTPFAGVAAGAASDDSYDPLPGVVRSTGFWVGLMNERSGVQFEFDISGWRTQDSPLSTYQHNGTTVLPWQHGHFYESFTTTRRRSASATALYARRMWSSRAVQATFLVGGGWVSRPSEYTWTTKEVLPDGTRQLVNTDRYAGPDDDPAAVIGVDVDVRISRHLSIVPSVRVVVVPLAALDEGGTGPNFFAARPQVAVRWRF
jgi:hypothetical protein